MYFTMQIYLYFGKVHVSITKEILLPFLLLSLNSALKLERAKDVTDQVSVDRTIY